MFTIDPVNQTVHLHIYVCNYLLFKISDNRDAAGKTACLKFSAI